MPYIYAVPCMRQLRYNAILAALPCRSTTKSPNTYESPATLNDNTMPIACNATPYYLLAIAYHTATMQRPTSLQYHIRQLQPQALLQYQFTCTIMFSSASIRVHFVDTILAMQSVVFASAGFVPSRPPPYSPPPPQSMVRVHSRRVRVTMENDKSKRIAENAKTAIGR